MINLTGNASTVMIPADGKWLEGELVIPSTATGLVIFAHGSGSSRHSPRNKFVAEIIQKAGLGTLLCDLLTRDEEAIDVHTRHLRFDIGLLGRRLVEGVRWIMSREETKSMKVGFFGASTGGAAALVAAARLPEQVAAVVSRGGRPDLAGSSLRNVKAPVLLIVGGLDHNVVELNRQAYAQLACEKELRIVPGATHLFEEPGTLETVGQLAAAWFSRYLC